MHFNFFHLIFMIHYDLSLDGLYLHSWIFFAIMLNILNPGKVRRLNINKGQHLFDTFYFIKLHNTGIL